MVPSSSPVSVIAVAEPAKRGGTVHAPGHLEVLRVRRVRHTTGGLQLLGVPASKDSRVREVRVTFVPQGQAVPAPACDLAQGTMDLFYPEAERREVEQVLKQGREHLCYFWEDAHRARKRAWLMASN
jgi:hypothetical protein